MRSGAASGTRGSTSALDSRKSRKARLHVCTALHLCTSACLHVTRRLESRISVKSTFRIDRAGVVLTLCLASAVSSKANAEGVMTPDQATQYVAFIAAAGEVCKTKFPDLAAAVDRWGTEGMDAQTIKGIARIRQSEAFSKALVQARATPAVMSISEQNCKNNFARPHGSKPS